MDGHVLEESTFIVHLRHASRLFRLGVTAWLFEGPHILEELGLKGVSQFNDGDVVVLFIRLGGLCLALHTTTPLASSIPPL